MGNEGISDVKYNYYKAAFVIWPRANVVNILCSNEFASPFVYLAIRAEVSDGAHGILAEVMQFAESNVHACQPRLQELLDVVIKMKNLEAAQKVLALMQTENELGNMGI